MNNVRQYMPNASSYAERIPESRWEELQPILEALHKRGTSRAKMLARLASDYNFYPTKHQLNTKMAAWGYKTGKGGNDGQVRHASNGKIRPPVSTVRTTGRNEEQEKPLSNSVVSIDNITRRIETISDEEPACETYDLTAGTKGFSTRDRYTSLQQIQSAEQFCLVYDVADLLADVPGGSNHSDTAATHMIRAITTMVAYVPDVVSLLLYKDCLRWSAGRSHSQNTDWLCHQIAKLERDPAVISQWTTWSLYHQSSPATEAWKPGEQHRMRSASAASPSAYDDHPPVFNTTLTSTGSEILAQSGPSVNPLHKESFNDLLTWCEHQLDNLTFSPLISQLSSAYEILSYCELHIIEQLLERWISDARIRAPLYTIRNVGHAPLSASDLLIFKATVRAIKLISNLAVQRTEKFVRARVRHAVENGGIMNIGNELLRILQTALYELRSDAHHVFHQLSQPNLTTRAPWRSRPPPHTPLKELNDLLVQEISTLRNDPTSTRYQDSYTALARLYSHTSVVSDAMLYDPQSTSSVRSFRRSGIQVEGHVRPAHALQFEFAVPEELEGVVGVEGLRRRCRSMGLDRGLCLIGLIS